ncbi:MAG: hypothetical protein SF187_29235 [Deltaproteobacteria bacterium]|nr:hypothetical protein [Deltaproteobacteria bacterium]
MVQGRICSLVVFCFSLALVACGGAAGQGEQASSDEASGGTGGESSGGTGGEEVGGAGGGASADAGVQPGADGARPPDAAKPGVDAQPSDAKAAVGMSSLADEKIVWNGDGVGNGGGTHWMGRGQEGKTTLTYSDAMAFSPKHVIAFTMANINYAEFGWGIAATPANKYKKLGFWVNMVPQPGKTAPGNALVTIKVGGNYAAPGGGRGVNSITYNKTGLKGGWQQVVIPVADIMGTPNSSNVTEILIGLAGCGSAACSFTLYVDDIAFGN